MSLVQDAMAFIMLWTLGIGRLATCNLFGLISMDRRDLICGAPQ